jgi:hypothetical protein
VAVAATGAGGGVGPASGSPAEGSDAFFWQAEKANVAITSQRVNRTTGNIVFMRFSIQERID